MKRIVLVAAGAAMLMAGSAATADEMAGRIKSHQAKKLVVTDALNKDKIFELTAQTKIVLPHKLGTEKDLKVDYRVRVQFEMSGALAIAKEIDVEGFKASISRSLPAANRIIVKDKEGKEMSFDVTPGTKVQIDGAEKTLADLRPGDVASVFFEETAKEKLAVHVEVKAPVMTTAAGPGGPPTTLVDEDKFIRMKVFYGTDRTAVDAAHLGASPRLSGPARLFFWSLISGVVVAGIALALMLIKIWRKASSYVFTVGLTLTAAFAVPLLLAQPLSVDPAKVIRTGMWFGGDRGELSYGVCEVTIPKSHKHAELEAPELLRLEFREDPAKHVMLQKVEKVSQESFVTQVSDQVKKSTKRDAFVFIHGFNVSFEDAARRTGQLAYDLKFAGAALFFSWPSQGLFLDYTVDEANAEWAVGHLKDFLKGVATKCGAKTVHLIAHSMGNRVLTRALQGLAMAEPKGLPYFNKVVLAAPDIDASVFKNEIYPGVLKSAKRFTLYASSRDRALQLSKQVHGSPRAGESGDDIVVLADLDTIDVSNVDTSLIGHSYYGDNSSLLTDVFYLLSGLGPAGRQQLRVVPLGRLKYWVFAP